MTRNRILPIFVPHRGCPHQCVFCDQRTISGCHRPVTAADVTRMLTEALPLSGQGIEVAFYGGSFTAIPAEQQQELLDAVEPFLQTGAVASVRVSTRPDAKPVKERLRGEIDFHNVSLKLHGAQVLSGIDLHVEPGETVAIMGPTGAGKTSLVNLIPRFSDVSAGTLTIDGTPVGLYDLEGLRRSIGIATQDVFLFSDTVDGNIAYGDTSLSEEEVKRYAKMADVDFVEKLPEGYDTLIGERGTGLSGGQKQRIALARALAVRPSILILDDTTSAVDLETEKYIQDQLAHLDFPCTKLIVAQRISTTKRADKIVILDKGRVVDVGTHQELSQKPGYYREVFLLQNGQEEEKEVV